MRISETVPDNISIFAGSIYQGETSVNKSGEKEEGAIFAGNLNQDLFADQVAQRRKEAQAEAMKVIGEAFAGDRAIDEDLETRRSHVKELTAENFELQKKIDEIDEEQAHLQEVYRVTGDSQEQRELELLRKSGHTLMQGTMTLEEQEQVAEIRKRGLTEYQQRQLELDDLREMHLEEKVKNGRVIAGENAVIKGTKMERLKSSPMTKAREQAEAILEAAHEEILDMALEEGKKQIDEKAGEEQEKAEKIAEEREEREQYIEEIASSELLELDQLKKDVQKEVQAIADKMKLLAEDIKGAAVDSSL